MTAMSEMRDGVKADGGWELRRVEWYVSRGKWSHDITRLDGVGLESQTTRLQHDIHRARLQHNTTIALLISTEHSLKVKLLETREQHVERLVGRHALAVG